MTTTITGYLKNNSDFKLTVSPDAERTISVPLNLGLDSPFLDGCFLHQALRCLTRQPHTPREWQYAPIVTAIDAELRAMGAQRFEVEKNIQGWRGQPSGRADIMVHGLGGLGIAELKVVKEIPKGVRPKDVLQLAAYLRGAGRQMSFGCQWGTLIYADLTRGQIQFHSFQKAANDLVDFAAAVFAA